VPPELTRLDRLLTTALTKTAPLWPAIRQAYAWGHRAAHLLNNDEEREVWALRREYRTLLAEMVREQQVLGELRGAVASFLKVTKSYWMGLFRCYETPGVPRTNNDLEQCFGSARYHERRATGRKGASPALVVRGSVRLVAAVATRAHPTEARELRPRDLAAWRALRGELEERQETRRTQLRFRRDPDAYLRALEAQLLKPSLPS
jgi:hypothetical protein